MADGRGRKERPPRSLQDLLRIASEQGSSEAQTPSVFEEMSEERRKWLQEAIAAFSEDTYVKRMQECLMVLNKDDVDDDTDESDDKETAFERLAAMVDLIDNANDLHKIGGFPIVVKYLNSSSSELRWRAADLIAILSQNNPYSQTHLNNIGVIKTLLQLLDNDTVDQVRIKSLYALLSMTSNFPEGKKIFLDYDGLSILLRALQGNVLKIKTKASSMLRSMISESLLTEGSTVKETLVDMGIVEQYISILHEPHKLFHEYIVDALAIIAEHVSKVPQECRRPELQFEKILNKRIQELEADDKEAYETEIESCKKLVTLCFGNQGNDMDSSLR